MSEALPSCILQYAVDCLHPARVQSHALPCREQQQYQLAEWAQSLLVHGRTGSVHICGSPGVGKTATLTAVSAKLREWAAQRGCMELFAAREHADRPSLTKAGSGSDMQCAVRAYAVHYVNAMALDSDPGSIFTNLQGRMRAAESLLGSVHDATVGSGRPGAKSGQKRKASVLCPLGLPTGQARWDMPGHAEVESFLQARDGAEGAHHTTGATVQPSSHQSAVSAPAASSQGTGQIQTASPSPTEDDDIIEIVPPPVVREKKKSRMDIELEKQKAAMAKYMRKPAVASTLPVPVKEQRAAPAGSSSNSAHAQSASVNVLCHASPAHAPPPPTVPSSTFLLTPTSALLAAHTGLGGASSSATPGSVRTTAEGQEDREALLAASKAECVTVSEVPTTPSVPIAPLCREAVMGNEEYTAQHKGVLLHRTEEGQVQAVLHILVIDETDALLGASGRMTSAVGSTVTTATQALGGATRAADALYKLFAWPHVPGSNVALISIANAIDMTEKHLPRLSSLGIRPSVLVFSTYTATQLEAIAMDRLHRASAAYLRRIQEAHQQAGSDGKAPISAASTAGVASGWWPALVYLLPGGKEPMQRAQWVISPEAVSLVCKKVASKDGDARKVLYLLRRALQSACERLCTPPAPTLVYHSSAAAVATEDEDDDMLQGTADGTVSGQSDGPEEDATLSALLAEIVGAAPRTSASGAPGASPVAFASSSLGASALTEAERSSASKEQDRSKSTGFTPMCDCCKSGFAWVKPAPQGAQTGLSPAGGTLAGTGKITGKAAGRVPPAPPPYAVSISDVSSLLRSAYEAATVRALMSLPRQGQVLMCAIRAVAEREAAKKARDAQYSEFVNAKEIPLLWATAEGAHQESLSAIDKAESAVQAESVESAMARAVYHPISAELVRLAYAKMCRLHCLAEISARAELKELLEVLRANGLVLVLQKGSGLGRGVASAGGRATRVQGSVNQGKQINWLAATSVQLHVPVSEIDLAFGELSFYKRIAAAIRTGEV